MDFELSKHALDMLRERDIPEAWVWRALKEPDRKDMQADSNVHYYKPIVEYGGRILHVVVNPLVSPKKVVTVFFDRKARR